MHTPNQTKTEHNPQLQEQDVRKPYEKPQVIYRAPLEAMAALCVPIPPGKSTAGCTTTFS
jgi:hypothetical protein